MTNSKDDGIIDHIQKKLDKAMELDERLKKKYDLDDSKDNSPSSSMPDPIYDLAKFIGTDFFFYWWNCGGSNTEQGFDDWYKSIGKKEVGNRVKQLIDEAKREQRQQCFDMAMPVVHGMCCDYYDPGALEKAILTAGTDDD